MNIAQRIVLRNQQNERKLMYCFVKDVPFTIRFPEWVRFREFDTIVKIIKAYPDRTKKLFNKKRQSDTCPSPFMCARWPIILFLGRKRLELHGMSMSSSKKITI